MLRMRHMPWLVPVDKVHTAIVYMEEIKMLRSVDSSSLRKRSIQACAAGGPARPSAVVFLVLAGLSACAPELIVQTREPVLGRAADVGCIRRTDEKQTILFPKVISPDCKKTKSPLTVRVLKSGKVLLTKDIAISLLKGEEKSLDEIMLAPPLNRGDVVYLEVTAECGSRKMTGLDTCEIR